MLSLLYAFSFLRAVAASANFDKCISEIRDGTWGNVGGTDNHGVPIFNISEANAITYDLCVRACGVDPEAFDWPAFYQQFSSWLLPYFALLSQLPFGAESRLSNLTSVLLNVGSPALAPYSLALTALNGRWVTRRFRSINYPNAERAASVLRNLQSAPVRISFEDGLLPSLVALHHNDEWWSELADGLKHSNAWSIAAVTSMGWVVIAYLLTIIDSFTDAHTGIAPPSRALGVLNTFGKGVGFVWLWLLPIVYGWIRVSPISDPGRLRRLFKRVDCHAHTAVPESRVPDAVKNVSSSRGLTVGCFPDHVSLAAATTTDSVMSDTLLCAPIFNYARVFMWSAAAEDVAAVFTSAAARARARQPVASGTLWERSTSPQVAAVHPDNRVGTLEEVVRYCGASLSGPQYRRRTLVVYERILVASLAAIGLQWGTTGAAMLVVYFAPTVGLSCESGSFLLYGVVATVVWLLMVLSSILAYHAHPDAHRTDLPREKPNRVADLSGTLAVVLRRMAKVLATANTAWIVSANIAQFSNFFDRCWCNSCVLSLGSAAYNVVRANAEDLASMKSGWIGGVVLGTGTAVVFILFIHLLLDRVH